MQGQSVVIRMKHVISGDESIFKGIITEIGMDGERGVSGTIHYRGCSPTILLESGKTMDSFMDYTLSAIVGEVVKNYGNGVEIVNKPLFNEQIPYVQMHEETGYEFLRRIAYQYGEWFYYDGQKLHFGNPQKDKNETVTYDVELETVSFGSRIAPFHYSRHDYMAEDDRPLYADDSAGVNGINTYLANAIRTSESIYQSPTTLYNKAVVGHPVHMNRLLEFEKGRDTASLVWLRGKSKTCRVRIGEPIAVKIPASMCNRRDLGQYRVMSVIHEVDKNGVYSNTFEGIPASMERIPVSNVVIPQAHPMLAKVISNADPESQGRVKVQFVWQEEQNKTTNWIRVRSLDAGSSEVVSKNIVYFDENEKINSKNNGIELFGIQNGSITTASKKMITTIVSVNNHYRYKVSLEWTKIPSTRSYDIIGLGIDNTVKVYSTPVFQQNFCYSSNNCSSSNTHTRNTSSVGIGASFRLPTVKLVSLSSYLYFDVEKRNSGTLTSQNAYGDYSHATKSISQEYITNYYVNRGGIILDSSISDYYDNITPAVAKWTGSW